MLDSQYWLVFVLVLACLPIEIIQIGLKWKYHRTLFADIPAELPDLIVAMFLIAATLIAKRTAAESLDDCWMRPCFGSAWLHLRGLEITIRLDRPPALAP